MFYYGISRFEQKNYTGAIELFDQALAFYPEFSDVQVYKSKCLDKLGKTEEAEALYEIGEINGRKGFTINEDNAIYESIPLSKEVELKSPIKHSPSRHLVEVRLD